MVLLTSPAARNGSYLSSQQFAYDLTMNICQSELTSLMGECQSLVIQAKQSKNCCLQIVHVDRVFRNMKAKLVGLTDRYARLHSASREPNGERLRMMVPAQAPF